MTIQTQAVLGFFLDAPASERYGLEVADATGLKSGTLYPILARLEAAGWLTSEWEVIDPHVEGRRPRRHYRLTAAGAVAAREAIIQTVRLLDRRFEPNVAGLPGL